MPIEEKGLGGRGEAVVVERIARSMSSLIFMYRLIRLVIVEERVDDVPDVDIYADKGVCSVWVNWEDKAVSPLSRQILLRDNKMKGWQAGRV